MTRKSVIIQEAESKGASKEFLKFLEAGYEMKNESIVYKKIVNAVEEDELERYINTGGDFVTALWEGKEIKRIYGLADSTNRKILEKAFPDKL